jgi:RNA polymerase sigma-70 factor (ECF subfamily)
LNHPGDPLGPARKRLLGLAYRMLGSRADAEDVLQDAYLRYSTAREVIDPSAYLTTVVTRLCLDRLKSARAQREAYVGPWLPEPVEDPSTMSPEAATELADDISFALMLALDRLSPGERAAFLLHDVFDLTFAEVGAILGRSDPACRQLASRARTSVRRGRPAAAPSPEAHLRLLKAFGLAVTSGDVQAIAGVLREDAVLVSDGGGKRVTALRPIIGAERIARLLVGANRKFGGSPDRRAEVRPVNGALAVWTYEGGSLETVWTIAVAEDRIIALYSIGNPDKLADLRHSSCKALSLLGCTRDRQARARKSQGAIICGNAGKQQA